MSAFKEIDFDDFIENLNDFQKLYKELCEILNFENPPEFELEEFRCPLSCSQEEMRECNGLLSWLKRILLPAPKVREIERANGSIEYELIFPNRKSIIIDPLSPSLATDISFSLLKIFRYPAVIDFRREQDREAKQSLFRYLVTHVSEVVSEEEIAEDSETLMFKEAVLSILYSRELTEELSIEEGTAFFDGTYAYYSRDALLSALSAAGIQTTPTTLSRFLKGLNVEVVRKRVNGIKRTFYRFKPTEKQIEKFKKVRDGED